MKFKYNFSGYATRNDIKCMDGRVIRKDAFKHQDGQKVPLVWAHGKHDPTNVLGYAILENRDDGVYTYGVFNGTPQGQQGKTLVEHGDIESLSIHANQLKQKVSDVLHGMIREVSLVIAGANPGAKIDNVCLAHSDTPDLSEAYITFGDIIDSEGGEFEHEEDTSSEDQNGSEEGEDKDKDETLEHADQTIGEVLETLNNEQRTVVFSLIASVVDDEDEKDEDSMKQDDDEDGLEHAEKTIEEIFNTLSPVQKDVVYALIANIQESLNEDDMKQSDDEEGLNHNDEGDDDDMKKNIFEGKENNTAEKLPQLSHEDVQSIFLSAAKNGSLKDAVLEHMDSLEHAGTYGIDSIDYLFPDAKLVRQTPDFLKRRTEWVNAVLNACHKSPFSRIKTVYADITPDEARAKGYVTAALKDEEVFELFKRTTEPQTIYKKQKLDRDDVIDITDFSVVSWVKAEMRVMLDEEIARAILVGDGRSAGHADKIKEANIRPIYNDADAYTHKVTVASGATTQNIMDEILRNRNNYKGSGSPKLYCTTDFLTDMLILKDTTGRRIYKSKQEVADAIRVSDIIEVEVMTGVTRVDGEDTNDLLGVIVNLQDYTLGADKGGKISMFDDFDIDYNQHKYLLEGRMSGALTKPKSALTIEQTQAAG